MHPDDPRSDIDCRLHDCDDLCLLHPLTAECRSWLEEHVDSESLGWIGDNLVIDHRSARELANELVGRGFMVA